MHQIEIFIYTQNLVYLHSFLLLFLLDPFTIYQDFLKIFLVYLSLQYNYFHVVFFWFPSLNIFEYLLFLSLQPIWITPSIDQIQVWQYFSFLLGACSLHLLSVIWFLVTHHLSLFMLGIWKIQKLTGPIVVDFLVLQV